MEAAIARETTVVSTETRSARRQRQTRETILDAAERMFFEHGFQRARVSEIARLADVSVGSIYVHFDSKEGLYAALAERAIGIESEYLNAVFDGDMPDLAKVLAIGDAYLRFFSEHEAYFRMLVFPREDVPIELIEKTVGTPLGRRVTERALRLHERLVELIRACQDQRVFRAEIDAENAAWFIWSAWNGVIASSLRNDPLQLPPGKLEAVIQEGRLMIAQGVLTALLRGEDTGLDPELKTQIVKKGPTRK